MFILSMCLQLKLKDPRKDILKGQDMIFQICNFKIGAIYAHFMGYNFKVYESKQAKVQKKKQS